MLTVSGEVMLSRNVGRVFFLQFFALNFGLSVCVCCVRPSSFSNLQQVVAKKTREKKAGADMTAPAASIALHAVVFPSLTAVESADPSAAALLQSIRTALEKAEAAVPGITHEFVDHVLESEQAKGGVDSIEKLLRVSAQDLDLYRISTKTPELTALDATSKKLKAILASIPDQIADRTKFLGIIRDIAAAIKDVLDSVNSVAANNEALLMSHKQALDQQKKVFIRGSKSFSDTLKRYFKDGKADHVYRSAHRLVNQINMLLRTIKVAME
eukprot:m.128724 g.128724  ORF g.128724 m.128724 type:complete len:270 (+) comp19906_c0_seq2:472-1281(+)